MSAERVFFIGGTGNIGTKAVQDLLAKNVSVTLYARNPTKVNTLFPNQQNLQVVQGDLSDLSPLKKGIKGHTRLFLLISEFNNFVSLKSEIATIAYAAGVKQVLDISSESVNFGWRNSYIGALHYEAERKIFDIPNRGRFVALRPGRFMSNVLLFDRPTPDGFIFDIADADQKQSWVSTNDIGAIAAIVLSEDPEKHGDSCYTLISDLLTPTQRQEVLSRVLDRKIAYKQVTHADKLGGLLKHSEFPFYIAYDIVHCATFPVTPVTKSVTAILGRELETFEEYIRANKNAFA